MLGVSLRATPRGSRNIGHAQDRSLAAEKPQPVRDAQTRLEGKQEAVEGVGSGPPVRRTSFLWARTGERGATDRILAGRPRHMVTLLCWVRLRARSGRDTAAASLVPEWPQVKDGTTLG